MIDLSSFEKMEQLLDSWEKVYSQLNNLARQTKVLHQPTDEEASSSQSVDLSQQYKQLCLDVKNINKEVVYEGKTFYTEVRRNLLNCLRPDQERLYLIELNKLLRAISYQAFCYKIKRDDDYDDYRNIPLSQREFIGPHKEIWELLYLHDPLLSEVYDLIGSTIDLLKSASRDIASLTNSYSLVQQQPDTFLYLLLPDNKKVEVSQNLQEEVAEASTNNISLTATQRLLFIRLLQALDLFPRKPDRTDDAPELRAIALLTGLSYTNDLKGNNGAIKKVNQLLAGDITPSQIKAKLVDLEAVERVAKLLYLDTVTDKITRLKDQLKNIVSS